jgi:hypothetical protein
MDKTSLIASNALLLRQERYAYVAEGSSLRDSSDYVQYDLQKMGPVPRSSTSATTPRTF